MKNPCTHLLLLTLLGSTAGCFAVTDFEDLDTTRRESFELPFREQGEVPEFDILFVVDRPLAYNSAMFGAMDGLAGESGGMLNGVSSVLALPEYALDRGGLLHIGVISSDLGAGSEGLLGCSELGDDGRLQAIDPPLLEEAGITGCGWLRAPYLEVFDEEVTNMEDATGVDMTGVGVDEAVRCMVMTQMLRETTCLVRQPLGAFQKALDYRQSGEDEGFLRDTAGLAVVFITSEDDCTAVSSSLYQGAAETFGPYTCFTEGLSCEETTPGTFTKCRDLTLEEGGPLLNLDSLYDKVTGWKQRSRVVVSVMAGPYGPDDPARVITGPDELPTLQETCGSRLDGLFGLPGVRLELFRGMFQENSVFHEICDPQVDALFSRLSQKLAAQLTYRCMPFRPADKDNDPSNGRQVDCLVRDVLNPDTLHTSFSEWYPHCDEVEPPDTCWEVMAEEDCLTGYKMVLQRQAEPAEPYIVQADCEIDVTFVPAQGAGGP